VSTPVRPVRRIVLSGVSSDSHTWNLVFLQMVLEEQGFEVVNVGACVSDAMLLSTVRRVRPHAVVMSSVNGHGHRDAARAIHALRGDPDVGDVPAFIGGKLDVTGQHNAQCAGELLDAGFTAVFTESQDPWQLGAYLTGIGPAGGEEAA
jgi:methylaspartate mutase sigma subunit